MAAAAAAALLFPLPSVDEIRNYFGSTGWWGPAVFILAYAVLTLAPVPKNVRRLVPACVQYPTLDAAENAGSRKMLPLRPVSPAGVPGPMHP
ncbi:MULTISPECIES: hypothetical protein [unclassified Arthrobacter]|uniref:hypothetical protein n=1 Tax=unclassified Arthrobacter TaxID=235627 RepID=UPI001CFFC9DE|nr:MULTISPECIES: hypothetical protein [unclassified Arthrobacter]MCB5280793.1 hypothetical protein [Arthrobacter sp. ES1]WGZ79490.1 hypothetical protein QI450_16920 [Arthrobacter sp. EM1]